MKKLVGIFLCLILWACSENHKPKPDGFLALNFPPHLYNKVGGSCPYSFEINRIAKVEKPTRINIPCDVDIVYPHMKGIIYISYAPVHGNLKKLLSDAQKLPLKHAIKADQIIGDEYTNPGHKTYGTLYTITGNAASQAQFYLTDSTDHFMTGSIYFQREPNYDSIYPAAEYLKKDMKHLMETLKWKNMDSEN